MVIGIKGFGEYQREAHKTAIYPKDKALEYLVLGLVGEAGELANKIKKTIRDGTELGIEDAAGELGDVLWYLSELSSHIVLKNEDSLEYIANKNIEKLKDRKNRDVLKGSGDNR